MTARSAYRLRQRPGAEGFAAAWDTALRRVRSDAKAVAVECALHGWQEPVFHRGKQVGTRTRHDDRLLLALLRNPPRQPLGADKADLRDLRDFPDEEDHPQPL